MKPPHHLLPLIEKYRAGKASQAEIAIINEWYQSIDDTVAEIVLTEGEHEDLLEGKMKTRLLEAIAENKVHPLRTGYKKWRIAVAVLLFLTVSAALFFSLNKNTSTLSSPGEYVMASGLVNDIGPGGNRALLTLADGSVIVLDSAANGVIGKQGEIEIEKSEDGLLSYVINGKRVTENDEAFYNTITTPKGGQYQVTLSDGTKVWLNAASSIRFPVLFTGNERRVQVTGETYFEVAKNPSMPFKVKTETSEVEVLGTHFNINAYEDEEAIRTTLLEGKVKVSSTTTTKFLSPGQQSGITKNGILTVKDNADTEEAIAWINGRFQFKSATLKDILRQIARWYDVEIQYKGNVDTRFSGQLNRNENVSKVFEMLKLTGEVSFRIVGRTIIVSR